MSNTKGPRKLVFGTVVEHKNVLGLRTVEYVQLHQEDEPWITIDINQTVIYIVLGPHYNLQGSNF